MAARLRSKSESLSTPPHKATSIRHSSVTKDDFIDVTFNKSQIISPLAKQLQNNTGADANSISVDPSSSKSKKGPALKRCPCGSSSGGKAWLLKCTACEQMWHNSCANLKGNLPKSTVDQLDHWQCPWCFTSPFEPPKKHKSVSTAKALTNTVFSDAIVTQIEQSIKSSVLAQNAELLTSIRSDLDKLSKGVTEFAKNSHGHETKGTDKPLQEHDASISSVKNDMVPPKCDAFFSYKDNFVSDEQAADLIAFFDSEEFKVEGSRKVASYGERYHYKGSTGSEKPIPEALTWLIEKVKSNMKLQYDLNQVLVNKYESAAALPSHSDNEGSIKPDSSIFTVSLGSSGKILFSNLISEGEQELTVEPKSLYEMTRQSQNFYKHQVLPNESNTVRYSITLRSVHWTNFNSTYAVGDSNFGGIEFGSGRGKVGKATPGFRDWAACVKDIVPTKCASYRNVVIMCGTNDLKNNKNDVLGTYKVLKGKIEQIRSVNEHGNIFVCPVLPSRDLAINQRINEFNRYLFHDLQQSNLGVNFVHGFNEFAAHGVLKDTLHDKRTPKDVLHINVKGYSILVRLIKQAIFSVKKSKKTSTTGRLYSHVVRPT